MARSAPLPRILLTYVALTIFSILAIHPLLRIFEIGLHSPQVFSATAASESSRASLFREIADALAVGLSVALAGVMIASSAAYMISRARLRAKSSAHQTAWLTWQVLPALALLCLLYFAMVKLQLGGQYLAILLGYGAIVLPCCIWQLRSYYDTIPLSLEEAAIIDGCSRAQSLLRIFLPAAMPALIISILLSFTLALDAYLAAMPMFSRAGQLGQALAFSTFHLESTPAWLYAFGAILVAILTTLAVLFLNQCSTLRQSSVIDRKPDS